MENRGRALAEIRKGQQLAGHSPSEEAMERARRVLDGETTVAEAREEIARKFR